MSRNVLIATSALLLLLLVGSVLLDRLVKPRNMTWEDIYYSWVEGGRILHGQNPYARVFDGDLETNDKYATYFPLFYEASYLSERLGLEAYPPWLAFWRSVFIAFELATAVLLYLTAVRRNLPWFGVLIAAFWLFNRWTIQMLQVVNLDFVPLFFLLLSLVLFARHQKLSLFFFSLSLGVKQIAIFLTPLYLMWLWRSSRPERRIRDLLTGAAIIASVPFVTSIPFLLWEPRAFVYSIFFSITRVADTPPGLARSLSYLLDGQTLVDRLLMFGLMIGIFVLAWRMPAARYVAAFLVMLVFVCFNPVIYIQYILWAILLGLMVLCDVRDLLPASSPPSNLAT
ncbi:MAG TPA: hypothetical protein VF784_14875 [Anaerolineales bacterium]